MKIVKDKIKNMSNRAWFETYDCVGYVFMKNIMIRIKDKVYNGTWREVGSNIWWGNVQ